MKPHSGQPVEREDDHGLEGVWAKSPARLEVGRGVLTATELWRQLNFQKGRAAPSFSRRLAAQMPACAAVHYAPTFLHGSCMKPASFQQLPQRWLEILRWVAAEKEAEVTQQDSRLLVVQMRQLY
jgi:hypothetical protein